MSNKKKQTGMTRQGVRDLSYLKGKSVGVRLPPPPNGGINCDHLGTTVENHTTGDIHCTRCKQSFDY